MSDNPFHDKYEASIELDSLSDTESLDLSDVTKKSLFTFSERSDLLYSISGTLCSVICAFGSPILTIIYGRIFKKLSDFYLYNYKDFDGFIKDVGLYCGLLIVVGAVKALFTLLMILLWMKHGERQQIRIRHMVFKKIMIQDSVDWLENFKNINGEMTQINRCIEETRCGTSELLALMVEAVISALVLFIVAMYYSWSVTLVVLALTPLFALTSWFSGKLAYKYATNENTFTAQSSKIVNWCLLNPAIARLFNGKDQEIVNFKNLVDRCSSSNFKFENVITLNIGILKTLSLLMFVQGFWFGNTMIRLKKVNINEVFTAFSACLMLASTIGGITELIGEVYRTQAAIGKIFAFLNTTDTQDISNCHSMSPTWCNGLIEIQDVSFKYANKQDIALKNLSIKFKPNEFNFVIGKSGSGKSTIAQLIMNFYQASTGRVLLDNLDINLIDKNWIKNNLTLILLSPMVFNQSLRNNLAMAVLNKYETVEAVPDSLINDASEFALLAKLITRLGGTDKPINNASLSGGERQRLSIARAKLRNTQILIIDEGLSALDRPNRIALFNTIREWRRGKTTIFITHQLDTIENDDFVFIIEDGSVKTQGHMSELGNETLIKDANLALLNSPAASNTTAFDSDMESDDDTLRKAKRHSFKKYNYLKDPIAMTNVETTPIVEEEDIYPLSKILFRCIKTVNSKLFIAIGLFFAAIFAVSNPIFSYLFSRLLDNMVNTSIGINASSELKKWSCIVIGIAVVNGISYYLSNFLLAVASEKWVNQLRKKALMKINNQDLSFFHEKANSPNHINALLMNDTRDLRTMISKFLSVTISILVLVLIGSIFAIILGWKLALTGVAFVVLILLVTVAYSAILQKRETSYKDRIVDLEAINFEMINGIKTIHSLDLNNYFFSEFDNRTSAVNSEVGRRAIHTGISMAVKDLVISIATGILLYYGMRLVGKREYERLQFIQVITLLLMTFSSASMLLNELPDITRGQRSATYILKLLDKPDSKIETEGSQKITKVTKDRVVEFRNVNFSYMQNKKTLHNMSFTVKQKDIFGLVGESGSGKSTIINLITRLYGNYEGSITVNGTELTDFNVEFLRDYISIVPQNPVFFEGTIYDNLTYGLPRDKLVNTNIDAYLKLCSIEAFINSLSHGLQSNIGSLTENALVSTGQLQRLAMVRAILRKPKILILDECTSNLDSQNFNLFKSLIVKLNRELGTTIILVSHSSELLEITTNSIVLSKGYRV